MMKVVVSALFLAAVTGAAALAREVGEQALEEVSRKFSAAWNGGDAPGLAALYAQDAVLTSPGGKTFRGRQAIQDNFAADFREMKGSKVAFSAEEFRHLGADAAVWRCEWKITGMKDGASAQGTGLAVLVRSGVGWLMVEDVAALTPAGPGGPEKPGHPHGAGDHGHDRGPSGHSHDQ